MCVCVCDALSFWPHRQWTCIIRIIESRSSEYLISWERCNKMAKWTKQISWFVSIGSFGNGLKSVSTDKKRLFLLLLLFEVISSYVAVFFFNFFHQTYAIRSIQFTYKTFINGNCVRVFTGQKGHILFITNFKALQRQKNTLVAYKIKCSITVRQIIIIRNIKRFIDDNRTENSIVIKFPCMFLLLFVVFLCLTHANIVNSKHCRSKCHWIKCFSSDNV